MESGIGDSLSLSRAPGLITHRLIASTDVSGSDGNLFPFLHIHRVGGLPIHIGTGRKMKVFHPIEATRIARALRWQMAGLFCLTHAPPSRETLTNQGEWVFLNGIHEISLDIYILLVFSLSLSLLSLARQVPPFLYYFFNHFDAGFHVFFPGSMVFSDWKIVLNSATAHISRGFLFIYLGVCVSVCQGFDWSGSIQSTESNFRGWLIKRRSSQSINLWEDLDCARVHRSFFEDSSV